MLPVEGSVRKPVPSEESLDLTDTQEGAGIGSSGVQAKGVGLSFLSK
jgi:hypothetical protein